jgi:hypothetical protein
MRDLRDEVFLVGDGVRLGYGLSDDPDYHIYLINGGASTLAVVGMSPALPTGNWRRLLIDLPENAK